MPIFLWHEKHLTDFFGLCFEIKARFSWEGSFLYPVVLIPFEILIESAVMWIPGLSMNQEVQTITPNLEDSQ